MVDLASRSETISYARYLNARRCYGPSFSPDGTRLAFIADLSGVPEAWAVPARGGWPEQLTFIGDRVGLVAYAPNRDELLVGTDRGGDENVQLARLALHGAWLQSLTHDPGAMHPFGAWSPDGRAIAYASNERDSADLDVVVQDLQTGAERTVLEADGHAEAEGWSPDGSRLVVSLIDSSANNDLEEIDLRSGARRALTEHADAARYLQPAYRPDGQALYLITDEGRDFLGLVELDLQTLRRRPIVDENADVEMFSLAPSGDRVAIALNVEGFSRLFVLALGSGARPGRVPIQIPAGVVARGFVGNWRDALAWSPDGRRLAFSLTTPRETQNVWLADPASGEAWPLTHATIGAIPGDRLIEPELVHYPTFDERQIPAFLFRPSTANAASPAVVYIHGGPESQSRPAFDPTLQFLASQGYVVLVPNVRGSTGYGKAYAHLDDGAHRPDAVADVKAAADWLARGRIAHPKKIAAMGGSYGGFMVLSALATDPEVWAAGVDLYGVANFVSFLEHTHPFRRRHREAEYGSLERDRAMLERISPTSHLDWVVAPLFVAHGENDIRIPMFETEQVVAALHARGVPVELVRLAREGHGFARLENKLVVYPAIARFLDRYVSRPG